MVPIALAQMGANPTVASSHAEDLTKAAGSEVVARTPCTVSTNLDRGYQAQSTLGGSRLRTDLKDVAAPTTAFTAEFLQDVAATSTDEIGRYLDSTEYDFGEDSGPGQNFLKDSSTRTMRMRGLAGRTISVNFFKSNLTADTFNVERIDQSRGPNSVLFGIGNPGGLSMSPPSARSSRGIPARRPCRAVPRAASGWKGTTTRCSGTRRRAALHQRADHRLRRHRHPHRDPPPRLLRIGAGVS